MFTPNGIVTLTTDFGLHDAYVAIMKGVILGIASHARIADYTHGVRPGNIVQGAYLLRSGYLYFPRGTVHVAVVDPGVGSERRAIALQTPDATFIGPDNGVFSLVMEDARHDWGAHVRIVELNESHFWLPHLSATFHGRDVFAPVAAHVLNGTQFDTLGRPLESLTQASYTAPLPRENGVLQGRIIHVDRFGNCLTNITETHLNQYGLGRRIIAEIIDQQLTGLFRTYADGPLGVPMCLIGSSGHIELAVRNGNAAQYLGVDIDDKLRIRRSPDNL